MKNIAVCLQALGVAFYRRLRASELAKCEWALSVISWKSMAPSMMVYRSALDITSPACWRIAGEISLSSFPLTLGEYEYLTPAVWE